MKQHKNDLAAKPENNEPAHLPKTSDQTPNLRQSAKPESKRETKQMPVGKESGEPDIFLLEKIFPDAHDVFSPSSNPDPKGDCIVALDTNALLLPYSVGKDDLTALGKVYSTIAKEHRLFIPERVAREFIRHRDRKLAEMAQAIETVRSKINIGEARIAPLFEGLVENASMEKANTELREARKAYLAALDGLRAQVKSWRGNDPVTSLYASLFTKEQLARPAETNEELLDDWVYRVQNKVPPGYKDSGKDDKGIGDFTIWMSLLSLGSTLKKDLIFVTGEEKADWFVRSGGEPLYPRPELVIEYRRRSGGRTIKLSSLRDLLREMSAPEDLVNEVAEAELTANSAIQATGLPRTGISGSSSHSSIPIETAVFDYSTQDGRLHIEGGGKRFDLAFSKASDRSIHLYRSGTTHRIARVKTAAMDLPTSMDQQETTSRTYTIQIGEGFLVENDSGDVLAARVNSIKDDTRGAKRDEINFTYAISSKNSLVIIPGFHINTSADLALAKSRTS